MAVVLHCFSPQQYTQIILLYCRVHRPRCNKIKFSFEHLHIGPIQVGVRQTNVTNNVTYIRIAQQIGAQDRPK